MVNSIEQSKLSYKSDYEMANFSLRSSLIEFGNVSLDLLNGEPLYEIPAILVTILSVFYGIISVTAVLGNGLVLWFVVRRKKLRTVTSFFIGNLESAIIENTIK